MKHLPPHAILCAKRVDNFSGEMQMCYTWNNNGSWRARLKIPCGSVVEKCYLRYAEMGKPSVHSLWITDVHNGDYALQYGQSGWGVVISKG